MRRLLNATFFLTLLIASCAPQPAQVAQPTSIPTPTVVPAPQHAPEIRFALIGEPRDANVWELFDQTGAAYTDYALRAEYWPRLYHLAPPEFTFEPLAASGMTTEVTQENDFYVAAVQLRADLKWTDGSSFSAEDAAFTANTALSFELGYDWDTYYPREYLDHVEALDLFTVKYYFKKKPNAGVWQYGVLQGPIVQKAFWEKSVENAAVLLPADSLRADIKQTYADLATVIFDVAELTEQVTALRLSGKQNRILDSDLKRKQNEQIFVQSNLDRFLEEYAANLAAAQTSLYKVNDENEPVLGAWIPAEMENGQWVNTANPDFPFAQPGFDRAVYQLFESEEAALTAFENGDADFVLSPNGLSGNIPNSKYSPTDRARFLVFNPLKTQFADPAFHSALSCMLDRNLLAVEVLQNRAVPLDSFILSSQWHEPTAKDPCAGMDESARIDQAVKFLKDAGYSWTKKPGVDGAGSPLFMPNGQAFPGITLSTPSKEDDPLRHAAAAYIAERAQYLGVPLVVREMSLNDVLYAVFSSQKYDVALTGWKLSEYPGYLCDLFGGQSLLLYNSSRFQPACEALGGESDLERARQGFRQIESALMSELPFIPLFTVARADVYQNISFPVESVLNGWGGLYGAPAYAVPFP